MMMKKLTAIQVKNTFKPLPAEVKENLGISKENYSREEILVTASNNGYRKENPFV